MSSIADDSSVDDSVSSVGPDGWDAIDHIHDEDEDSDDSPELLSRVATPIIDELQQSAVLVDSSTTPPEPLDEDETELGPDLQTPTAPAPTQQESDVSFLFDGEDITFPEQSSAEKHQEVTCSWAEIRGTTARGFVEASTWSHLDKLDGSLKMKLAARPLELQHPLKMFYVGSSEHQSEVERKIGSALLAGQDERLPSPRRRSIMPLSLNRQSPEVALVPDTATKMEIDTCTGARHLHDGAESLVINMESGTLFKSSFDRETKSYVVDNRDCLPDLAVIQISEDDTTQKSLRLRARVFLARHSIPTIIITSGRQWESPSRPLTVDVRSPHFVVHVPCSTLSESAVLKRLPVDLDTFVGINSLQLSRSLACMLSQSQSKRDGAKLSKQSLKSNTSHLPVLKSVLFAISVLVAFYAMGVPLLNRTTYPQHAAAPVVPASEDQTTTSEVVSRSVAAATTSAAPTVSKSLVVQQAKALAQIPHKEKFGIEILGDNVILVKPPRWVLESKRTPKLDFVVERNGIELEYELSQISNTRVFAINLPWESAYGPIDVRIKGSVGSVKIDELKSVSFGSSYWKMWSRQTKFSEPSDEEAKEKTKPEELSEEPKDRLAEDVRALSSAMRKLVKAFSHSLKSRLVLTTDERLRIRQKKRQAREEKLKAIVSRVYRVQGDALDTVSKEVRRWTGIVSEYKRTHYREQQKDLLKLWWRISGVPDEHGAGAEKPRHNGKPKKAVR